MENINNFSDDPKVWGPFYWYVLKSIAHNYPENPNKETIMHIKGIFYGLQSAIPCSECRNHYREYIKKHTIEPAFASKRHLLNWITNLELSIKKRNSEKHKEQQQTNLTKHFDKGSEHVKLQPNTQQVSRPKQIGKPLLLNSKVISSCSTCGNR